MRYWYYCRTIERVVVAILDYFNDIVVRRVDEVTGQIKEIKVPISFGPMGKDYGFRKEALLLNGKTDIYYQNRPKITFTFSSLGFDESRASGINEFRTTYNVDFGKLGAKQELAWRDLNPTAYTLGITMTVLTEHTSDLLQILEQILPWFEPMVFLRIKEFDFLNQERNIPLRLNSTSFDITSDYNPTDPLKVVNANIDLTANIVLYKPITDGELVKIINATFDIQQTNTMDREEIGLLGALQDRDIRPKDEESIIRQTTGRVEDLLINEGMPEEIDVFETKGTISPDQVQNWELNGINETPVTISG